ncbi:phage tail tape measure protein [Thiohalophilus sp.]|uniref:phage tail tape measure protein n=1 Tax=Thiohalophilus sp. TaxID=3028392 RepID=UPI002ACEBDC6|nr:phage tail tape measure protein [Thiohalophilus sp.]MDZ7804341.1 phage tail tape measure protein [Thiohalophilus sp.]
MTWKVTCQNRSRSFEKAMKRMSKRGQRHLSGLSRTAAMAGKGLDRIGNRYAALLTGGVMTLAVRNVSKLEARLTRLRTDGRMTEEQIASLKQQLFDVATDPSIRVDPNEILGGFEEIITRTGDAKFAQENIRNIALGLQATGSEADATGAVMSNFYKGNVKDSADMISVLGVLIKQAKQGSVAFREVATVGNALFAPYLAAGQSGAQAFKDMGAVAQVTIDASKSADTATEATKSLIAELQKKEIQDFLKGRGIEVFDEGKIRSLPKIIEEIVNDAGGDITKIGSKFGQSAIRVFQGVMLEGNMEKMKQLAQIQADGSEVLKDSAANAATFESAMRGLRTEWQIFADDNLAEPVKELSAWLGKLDKETVQLTLNTAKWTAGILGVAVAGRKIFKLYRGISGMVRGRSGKLVDSATGKGGAGALGSAKPIPVFVVNNGMGRKGRMGARGRAGGRGAGGRGGRMARGARGLASKGGRALGTAGLAFGAWEAGQAIGDVISDKFVKDTSFGDALGEGIAKTLALFGNEEAKRAVAANERLERLEKQQASMKIEITGDQKARVKELKSEGIEVDVDAGYQMSPMS